MSNSDIERIE